MFVVVQFSRTVVFAALPSSAHVVYHICSHLSILFSKVFSIFLTFFHLFQKWIITIGIVNHMHIISTVSDPFYLHFLLNFLEKSCFFSFFLEKLFKIFRKVFWNFCNRNQNFSHFDRKTHKSNAQKTSLCYIIKVNYFVNQSEFFKICSL